MHMPGHVSTRSDDEGYLDQDESQSEDEDGSEDEDSEDIFEHHRAQAFRAPRLSHTALTLLLERGRPVTRTILLHSPFYNILISSYCLGRALVTSSPLYQPMDTMVRLGYDVRIYARVPDYGTGTVLPDFSLSDIDLASRTQVTVWTGKTDTREAGVGVVSVGARIKVNGL